MFTRTFGIEAGYSKFGEPDDVTIPANIELETDSYDVFAVGKYWLSENFGLIGKAGFAMSSTEAEMDDDDATERHHNSTDLALAFGGQYDFTERFAIRGELEWMNAKDSGAVNMISLSGVFRSK